MSKQYERAVIPGRNGGLLNNGPTKPHLGGRKKKTDIIKLMSDMLEGDGFRVIEGELLDSDGNRTGEIVKIRASVPNYEQAAKAFISNLKKGDTKTLTIFLERTMGKVPLPIIGSEDAPPINLSWKEAKI